MRGANTFVGKLAEHLDWRSVYDNVTVTGENQEWAHGWCPFHEHSASSKSPSFSISKVTKYFKCHSTESCGQHGDAFDYLAWKTRTARGVIIDETADFYHVARPEPKKRQERRLIATYVYENLQGECAKKHRYQTDDGGKTFSWTDMNGNRGRGTATPTFWFAKRIAAQPKDVPIYITEGEEKTKTLWKHGLVATTQPDGAGAGKTRHIPEADWATLFADRTVYVIADNDAAGRPFARETAQRILRVTKDVYVVNLPVPEGHGVDDFFQDGGTIEEFHAIVAATSRFSRETNAVGASEKVVVLDKYAEPAFAADEIELVLINRWKDSEPLFSRGGAITRMARDGSLYEMKRETLAEIVGRHATFEKEDKEGNYHPCEPRDRIFDTYLARKGSWKLPPLRSVVRAPFVTPEGEVVSRPGYSEKWQTYLQWDGDPIDVPDRITHADAGIAAIALMDIFRESPFLASVDQVSAMLAILTAIQRPILDCAPMFAITAPTPASGKSLIANVCSIIATGKQARVRVYSDDPEDLGKQVFSALLAGVNTLLFDNVMCDMDSLILCQLLTEPYMSRRILGGMEDAEVPTAVTVFATGNNLGIVGDLVTRTVFISLDPKMESPEARVFERDLIAWAGENRRAVLRNALIVLAGYARAGYPYARTDSRFKAWSKSIRSAALWLNLGDPMERTMEAKKSNPAIRFLQAWKVRYGEQEVSCAQILKDAEDNFRDQDWRDVVVEICGSNPTASRLTRWMKRHELRWFGGLTLEQNRANLKWRAK